MIRARAELSGSKFDATPRIPFVYRGIEFKKKSFGIRECFVYTRMIFTTLTHNKGINRG